MAVIGFVSILFLQNFDNFYHGEQPFAHMFLDDGSDFLDIGNVISTHFLMDPEYSFLGQHVLTIT